MRQRLNPPITSVSASDKQLKSRISLHASRARHLNLFTDNTLTPQTWRELVASHEFKCAICKRIISDPLMDHIIALRKGGPNTLSNIQPLCHSCNTKKDSTCKDSVKVVFNPGVWAALQKYQDSIDSKPYSRDNTINEAIKMYLQAQQLNEDDTRALNLLLNR